VETFTLKVHLPTKLHEGFGSESTIPEMSLPLRRRKFAGGYDVAPRETAGFWDINALLNEP